MSRRYAAVLRYKIYKKQACILKDVLKQCFKEGCGGGGEIRTLGGDKPSPVFKTGAFGHSATPPQRRQLYRLE